MGSDTRQVAPKANFFLVGAPKAGTTSVDRLLRNHPDVFLSPIKEPCHFCPDVAEQIAPNLGRNRVDIAAYLASPERQSIHLQVVSRRADYARLFEGGGDRSVVGECSTFYLSSRDAPRAIHAYNPAARIVALLRNPLDRIRSHYAMDRSLGLATRPLLALVEEELALGEDANWGNSRFYVGASRYSRQLLAFHRYFAPDAVCVLSFEALVAHPDVELRRLFSFLGIAVPSGPLQLPFENRSRTARFAMLHSGLRGSGLKPLLARLMESGGSRRIAGAIRSAYYRKDARIVSDDDLVRLAALLRHEGLG